MNSFDRDHLLEDSLLPGALADSLATTRRAARHRRVRRRTVRLATAACLVLGVGWWLRPPGESPTRETRVVPPAPVPPFLLVTTAGAGSPELVRTAAAPSTLVVSTRDTASPTPRASEDELFAFAGSRPAALHRLPDGSARWMWLDEPHRF